MLDLLKVVFLVHTTHLPIIRQSPIDEPEIQLSFAYTKRQFFLYLAFLMIIIEMGGMN